MQRRLLSEKSLDFNNAVRSCLALEISAEDAHLMTGNGERAGTTVQAVKSESGEMPPDRRCWRCTGTRHDADACRFRNSRCYNCNVLGHVSRACPRQRRPVAGRPPRGRPQAGRGGSRQRSSTNAVVRAKPSASDMCGTASRRTRVRVRSARRVFRLRRERRARRVKGGGWPAPGTRGPVSRGICLCGVVGATHFSRRISLPPKLTPQRSGTAEVPTRVLDLPWLSTRCK